MRKASYNRKWSNFVLSWRPFPNRTWNDQQDLKSFQDSCQVVNYQLPGTVSSATWSVTQCWLQHAVSIWATFLDFQKNVCHKNVTLCSLVKPKFPGKIHLKSWGSGLVAIGSGKNFALTREKIKNSPKIFFALMREINPGKNKAQKSFRADARLGPRWRREFWPPK